MEINVVRLYLNIVLTPQLVLLTSTRDITSSTPLEVWLEITLKGNTIRSKRLALIASYGVIFQSDFQPYFKTSVCGAEFSYTTRSSWLFISFRIFQEYFFFFGGGSFWILYRMFLNFRESLLMNLRKNAG